MGSRRLWCIQMRNNSSTISSISLSLFLSVRTDRRLHVGFRYRRSSPTLLAHSLISVKRKVKGRGWERPLYAEPGIECLR
jgi:hypothetical protein